MSSSRWIAALGNFDGVHLGHREIVRTARALAGRVGAAEVRVLTFHPHPRQVLTLDASPPLLSSRAERRQLLLAAGADAVVEIPFDAELAALSPEEFLARWVGDAAGVVTGVDFRFGHRREGTAATLKAWATARGSATEAVEPVGLAGGELARVSSSAIREWVLAGEMERAALGLGRPFSVSGRVVRGDQRGRQLGFPTTNLLPEPGLALPPAGVYATRLDCDGRRVAVTNVGTRPTIASARSGVGGSAYAPGAIVVETHALDAPPLGAAGALDLYGREARVEFGRRLREERKFSSLDELKLQIARDCAEARGER